jgi:hypothetical protein
LLISAWQLAAPSAEANIECHDQEEWWLRTLFIENHMKYIEIYWKSSQVITSRNPWSFVNFVIPSCSNVQQPRSTVAELCGMIPRPGPGPGDAAHAAVLDAGLAHALSKHKALVTCSRVSCTPKPALKKCFT